jgi:intracellular multiplication protein IcmE
MAGKIQNVSAALKDSRTRIMLVVVLIIVIIGLAIGWLGLRKTTHKSGMVGAAGISAPPAIRATPGVGNPSQEYVNAVQRSDVIAAQEANRTGTSTIPTLTRAAYISGNGSQFGKNVEGAAATKVGCSVEELQRARQAGVRAEEIRASSDCDAAALRAAGYTAGELLNAGFSAKELRAAGFSAKELKEAGFSVAELKEAGFTAGELAAAGFSAGELSQVGFSADELTAAGVNSKGSAKSKDCDVISLRQARSKGVPASQLRDRGCDANALRLAGFTAQELRDAGFSAGELRRAGYNVGELRAAGFDANDLRNAGFSARELAAAGFQANQLEPAGFSHGELARAGIVSGAVGGGGVPAGGMLTGTTATAAGRYGTTPPGFATTSTPGMESGVAISSGGGLEGGVSLPSAPGDASLIALQQLQQRQAAQLSEQERLDTIQRTQEAMQGHIGDLFSNWSPPTTQEYVEGKPMEGQNLGGGAGGAAGNGAGGGGSQIANGPVITAGTILFATLDTSLNSDEPGPVLATIQGNYLIPGTKGCCGQTTSNYFGAPSDLNLKGAKLLGSFQRENKKVLLTFSALAIPFHTSSIGITAYAIDPNTARTALASNVNSHYMLRYGTLLASSFISGLGQVTMQSGSEVQNTLFSSTVTTASLSAAEKGLVALGQAAQQLGNATSSFFNTPPTVTLNSGTSIGILFMADTPLTSSPPAGPIFQAPQNPEPPLMVPTGPTGVAPTAVAAVSGPARPGFPPSEQSTTQTSSVQTTSVQPPVLPTVPLQPSQISPAPAIPYR